MQYKREANWDTNFLEKVTEETLKVLDYKRAIQSLETINTIHTIPSVEGRGYCIIHQHHGPHVALEQVSSTVTTILT
jgi:hypothetical protein